MNVKDSVGRYYSSVYLVYMKIIKELYTARSILVQFKMKGDEKYK